MFTDLMRRFRIDLAPITDKGNGGSEKGTKPDQGDDPGANSEDDKDAGGDEDGEGQDDDTPDLQELVKNPAFKKQLETWGNAIVQDRLERDRKQREREAAKQREKDLEEQEQHKTLAGERAARIAELEADVEQKDGEIGDLKGQLTAANKALSSYVDTLKEGLDESILELLKDKALPDQLEWLAKHAASVSNGDEPKQKRRITESPKPEAQTEAAKKQRREEAQQATARRYRRTF